MMSYLLVILSAVLCGISFPTVLFGAKLPNLGFLAWIGLVPFLISLRGVSLRGIFVRSFVFGLGIYFISLYWIYNVLSTFGHLSVATTICAMFIMMSMFAAYIALGVMLAVWCARRLSLSPLTLLPFFWVAMDFARNYFPFNGFPWSAIAYSQYGYTSLIAIADTISVYGITFLIIALNVILAEVVLIAGQRRFLSCVKILVPIVLIFVVMTSVGKFKISEMKNDNKTANVVLVQGNIPQSIKWNKEMARTNLLRYRDVTLASASLEPDLVIWPEAAFPYIIAKDETSIDPRMLGMDAQSNKTDLVMGVIADGGGDDNYNRAIVVDNTGTIKSSYDKMHLVPFGEYVPLEHVLFFVRAIASAVGKTLPGNILEPLVTTSGKLGMLICYEDIFPQIARTLTKEGADMLAVITNDAWFGNSSAAYQHMAFSVFRAVETHRSVVRAANTGVSAIIAPWGEVMDASSIFKTETLRGRVLLRYDTSTYVKYGDWFAWLIVALSIVFVILALGKKGILQDDKERSIIKA